jgi:hypothetical protein
MNMVAGRLLDAYSIDAHADASIEMLFEVIDGDRRCLCLSLFPVKMELMEKLLAN